MSQNKYMHPRNIYRNPPNFKELAIAYPEFRNFAKQDLKGKMTIDFKNQDALRALTTALLHKDFGLQVEIPLNRLVPTLPLRLNYLLWLEDLIQLTGGSEEVTGVDIGTGATCIYPLLAAKTKKWKMLATEMDVESTNYAIKNVESNCLQEYITVKMVEESTILKGAVVEDCKYYFSMCNPPFFSSEKEADSCSKARTGTRTLPHNGKTGSLHEMVIPGGEVAFIKQMIQESASLKNTFRIFTTMVGHKSSLKCLKSEVVKVGASSVSQTEFCQGHTTRWGLAWTFMPDISLDCQPVNRRKERPPMKYIVAVPDDPQSYTVGVVASKLKHLFTQLQIQSKELKRKEHLTVLEISTHKNTWSHQRRKRREQREQKNLAQLSSSPEGNKLSETDAVITQEGLSMNMKSDAEIVTVDVESRKRKNGFVSSSESIDNKRVKREIETSQTGVNESGLNISNHSTDKLKGELEIHSNPGSSGATQEPLVLKAVVSVRRVNTEIHVEMAWLEGSGGRDAVHQVLQYVKNNLK